MYLLSTEEGVLYFVPNIFAFITGQKYQKNMWEWEILASIMKTSRDSHQENIESENRNQEETM